MISPTSWVACGLLAIVVGIGMYEGGVRNGDKAGAARVQGQWDQAKRQQAEAALAAEAARRNTEQRIAAANLKDDDEVRTEIAHAHADADASRAAADGLRARLAAATAARDRAIRAAATTAAIGEAAGSATGVLTDVPSRLIEAARLYARVAGERGIAGAQCERRYDTAQQQMSAP